MPDAYFIALTISAITILLFVSQAFMSMRTTDKVIIVSKYAGIVLMMLVNNIWLIIITLIISIYVLHSLFTGEWE